MFRKTLLSMILSTLSPIMRMAAARYPAFGKRLQEKNAKIQIQLRDGFLGRCFQIENGRVDSRLGIDPTADYTIKFRDEKVAIDLFLKKTLVYFFGSLGLKEGSLPARILGLNTLQLEIQDALKNFRITYEGSDLLGSWFFEMLSVMMGQMFYGTYGTDMGDGVKRYTTNSSGGPSFVYVKDGKIIRNTPIEFDEKDPKSWTIEARGQKFTPPRKSTVSPHCLTWKSMVYSPDRMLYPMKRVDFDPNGERNPQNRGISGYERIGWDEAYDIVASEIKRMKTEYGPGAILNTHPSHHTFGHIGYFISARARFMNLIGHTQVVMNPDSWEGWYWGAMHHWGHSMRFGAPETYGTIEDCLKHCEMVVFWSSDPEATGGVYGAFEGTVRRQWLKDLGVKFVHIDPFYNHTAALFPGKWFAPRPDTDNALALAIVYTWITEGLYDKEFVEKNTVGFDEWKAYVLGISDGVPKTAEWQERETGIPAKDVRALAREWGKKKTYLAAGGMAGFGSACRSATGIEWARLMVCMMAMQGIGKPGVNMGNMQRGTPVDSHFFFPGYTEGGLSGDVKGNGIIASMYQRMPQLPTINTVGQKIPKQQLPDAILDGRAEGYMCDPSSVEAQFAKVRYPAEGYSPVRMYYRYGGAFIGTMSETNRWVKAYRSENLEFVVNQGIWFEGEAKFADIILPACTNFERWDISESASTGTVIQHSFNQLNHRIFVLQHKCIEPLGESKADYQIFYELAQRLGLGMMYSEGCTDLDWAKRLFEGTDLAKKISWKEFLKKGYYVLEAPKEELRDPVSFNSFAEGRAKETPEPYPLPSDYKEYLQGLQTQSGKFEFSCSSLKRFAPDDPERRPIPTYIPSWEGIHTKEVFEKYPLNLISPHPRYSFHSMGDAKDSTVNDIADHRVLIDGYYYWIARINSKDAAERGIKMNDLIRLYNDRGSVICAAQITERVPQGTVHSYEASASYDPLGEPGSSTDRGGCVNLLTSRRPIIKKSHAAAMNTCLIQVRSGRRRYSQMRKWNMVIDVAKCEDCNNCFLSCKDEHENNDWPGYSLAQPRHGHRWMNIQRKERGTFPMIDVAYRPTPCMHCENAPCIQKAQNQAVYKRKDGIVIIDPVKAAGQKDLVKACPYGAIFWNEEKQVPQKCTSCAHLLDDGWTKPRCVQACPTGALQIKFVEDAEMDRMIAEEQLEVLHPELKTKPRVYYKNLYRFSHCFIGGSVAISKNGVVDCAVSVPVALYRGQEKIAETTTDTYGDFKFDGLAKNSGEYSVLIHLDDSCVQNLQVPTLKDSVNLGTVTFNVSKAATCATNN